MAELPELTDAPAPLDAAETARLTEFARACKAAARACCSGGKSAPISGPEALHRPQTRIAPSKAPRLLPEPPMISIAQTWKVMADK